MTQLPESPDRGGEPPERRLSHQQFELVIRRAAELQARAAEEGVEEGMSEAEVLRIGREIGISPQYLRRALVEAGAPAARPVTVAERLFGPGWIAASRAAPGDAEALREHLDEYLVRREWLAAVRRFPERTVYEKARGVELKRILERAQAALGTRDQPAVGAGFELRRANMVEVRVRPLEEGYSYVTLGADLSGHRAGMAVGGTALGGMAGSAVAAALGIAVDPAAAILGLPVLGGSLWGARVVQLRTAERAQLHLESLLDCLERGEPLVRARTARR